MAELTLEEKGRFSHRARAFERMRPHLTNLARRRSGESF
jgi:inosine/xanthosine triphosphate pyrophosphatase family protein